ncbi:hypothetical protein QUF90_21160 [Desulfococcaceae bacterium HSG9]|nr:hypothetical protein [Desulfococcaceae bacterium HSG9]
MTQIIGNLRFLYIADCKAASLETGATIDHEQGRYLFPLPMAGDTPKILKKPVLNPPEESLDIILEPKAGHKDEKRKIGKGFAVNKTMESTLENDIVHEWRERRFIT